MWLPVLLLALLTIWVLKHPPKTPSVDEEEEAPRPKVKITVSKKGESALSNLPPSESAKGIRVPESEIEKWFRENPSLRDANKL